MTDVTIARAGAEVLDRLEPLWLALHEHHQAVAPGFVYQPSGPSWRARRANYVERLAHPGGFVLLALEADRPVGYALVHLRQGPDDTWITSDRLAELESLSVLPSHRGRGIGTQLLDRVDAELAAAGVDNLFISAMVTNADAIRFYQRRGLVPLMLYLARLPR